MFVMEDLVGIARYCLLYEPYCLDFEPYLELENLVIRNSQMKEATDNFEAYFKFELRVYDQIRASLSRTS